MKKFLAILLAIVFLAGCVPAPKAKPYTFISPNKQHPVVHTMKLGFLDACATLKVECVDYSWDGVDMSQMAVKADQVIAAGSAGVIAFVDKVVYEQDKKLIAAGIPTDAINVQVPEGTVPGLLAWVASSSTDYAVAVADFMGERMKGKGVIAMTQGDLNDVENATTASFVKEMALKYPKIKILPPEMEGFDVPAAIAKEEAILQAHPEVTAIFGTTGGSPTTWGHALQNVGKKPGELIVVGIDTTRPNLDMVKAGWVTAVVNQPIYDETYKALEILVLHNQGKPISYNNLLPAPLVTIDNIDKYYALQDRVDKMSQP